MSQNKKQSEVLLKNKNQQFPEQKISSSIEIKLQHPFQISTEVDQKVLKNLRLQQDLSKLNQFKKLQRSMKRGHKEVSQLEKQIQKVQNFVKETKQSIIKKHLKNLEQRKKQRQKFIEDTNKRVLQVIKKNSQKQLKQQLEKKKEQQQKRQKIEQVIKQKKQKYRNPINFKEIVEHQSRYLQIRNSQSLRKSQVSIKKKNSKRSIRIKSQIGTRYENQFEHLSMDHKSRLDQRIRDQYRQMKQKSLRKKLQLTKLIEKRNQYGNRVQIQKKNQRAKTQVQQNKIKQQMKEYWEKIEKQNLQKIRSKKPRVNTNLPEIIQFKDSPKLRLKKIFTARKGDLLQKLEKLQKIQYSYAEKLKHNNPESIDLLVQIGLTKAELLLLK